MFERSINSYITLLRCGPVIHVYIKKIFYYLHNSIKIKKNLWEYSKQFNYVYLINWIILLSNDGKF